MKQFTEESAATVPESREKKLEDALFRVIDAIMNGTYDERFTETIMPDNSIKENVYYQNEICVSNFEEVLEGCGPAYDLLKKELDASKAMMEVKE